MQEHDIVVVGAGTAGMPCAIEAALAGASVVVLEKADDVGGTLVLSAGQMSAAGARIGRERGIDDSPDRHFDDVMALGHGKADRALVRLAVDQAPRTIDWLEELGFPFPKDVPVIYHGHEAYSVRRTYWGRELGHSVLGVLRPVRRTGDHRPDAGRVAHPGATLLMLVARASRLNRRGGADQLQTENPQPTLGGG